MSDYNQELVKAEFVLDGVTYEVVAQKKTCIEDESITVKKQVKHDEEITRQEDDKDLGGMHKKYLIGKYVIVRCRDAGVHAGVLVDYHGRTVVLKDSKRMWYWVSREDSFLSGCAVSGITKKSKTGVPVPMIVLTETCEVIECTEEAEEHIRNAPTVPGNDD